MNKAKVLQMITNKLGDNFKEDDTSILEELLDMIIIQAENISNREIDLDKEKDENLKILSPEIIDATVIAYQTRGVEAVKSQSELGQSNTFVDYTEKLRNDIIKNGKRVVR